MSNEEYINYTLKNLEESVREALESEATPKEVYDTIINVYECENTDMFFDPSSFARAHTDNHSPANETSDLPLSPRFPRSKIFYVLTEKYVSEKRQWKNAEKIR